VPGDEKARPPGRRAEGVARSRAAKPQIESTVARERIQAIDRHRRVCAELEQLASLVRYYGPRRPRPVTLAQFLVEGWWLAS
jgi:hypothetical protein